VPTNVRVVDHTEYEREFNPIFPPDAIPPIYEPVFVPAADFPYVDEELVIGVSRNGDAKAYPITMLRQREIVNDEIGGVPILVTW